MLLATHTVYAYIPTFYAFIAHTQMIQVEKTNIEDSFHCFFSFFLVLLSTANVSTYTHIHTCTNLCIHRHTRMAQVVEMHIQVSVYIELFSSFFFFVCPHTYPIYSMQQTPYESILCTLY